MKLIAVLILTSICSAGCSAERYGDTGSVISRPLHPPPDASCDPECVGKIPVTRLIQERVATYRTRVAATSGSTMLVIAQAEVTNDLGYTVGLGRYIQRTLNGSTTLVNRPNMANITSQMHHESLVITAFDEIEESGEATYELVLYAVSPYVMDGDFIRVEPNYGSLEARKLK